MNPQFSNFDEKEEATCITQLTYLKFRPFMYYVIVPLLSICTAFILPIFIYWKKTLQLKLFYKKETNKYIATHLLVEGSQGNIETQKLGLETLNVIDSEAIIFTYRFIKY
jgi:hypothetical protein